MFSTSSADVASLLYRAVASNDGERHVKQAGQAARQVGLTRARGT